MRLPVALLLVCLAALPASVRAQDPRQFFDLFRGELDRQMERQRRRQNERDHQQQYQHDWNAFLAQWKACFEDKNLAACDAALAFYNLADNDRPRLIEQRQAILNEAARRETEAAERDRQAQWAAEAARRAEEERRARELVERRAEELRRIRELADRQAEQQRRARELTERQAEQRRARELAERRAEEQRLADLRSYTTALDECRRFVALSCDTVITSPLASADDRTRAQEWRAVAIAHVYDRSFCQGGSVAACDRALASPAATDEIRAHLVAWRRAASPWYRTTDYVHGLSTRSVAAVMALPTSTLITGGMATVLAAMVAIMARRRPAPQPTPATPVVRSAYGPRLRRAVRRTLIAARIWWRDRQTAPTARPQQQPPADPIAAVPVVAAKPVVPRDPETALAALELAHAYLVEVEERIQSVFGNPDATTDVLNTLSLASKQLAAAERADPSATFPAVLEDGSSITHTQPKLKALALYFEAAARSRDRPRHALSILAQAAALDPENDRIPFIAGVIHSELLQKGPAIAAFERALALDPHNINYRKELARAQSISGAEIVYDRAAKGVRTTINIGRWVVVLFWVVLLGSCTISAVRVNTATTDQEQREAVFTLMAIWAVLIAIGLFRRGILRMKLWVRENSW